MRSTIGLVFVIIMTTMAVDLPADFKICSKSDPQWTKCFGEAVESAINLLRNGLPSFKILPIEPLQINRMKFGDDKNAVSLKHEYWNIKLYGISKGIKVKIEKADLNKLIYILNISNPQINFVANYKTNGKILLLPIYGEGICNISLQDVITRHEAHFERYEKNGEIYIRPVKYLVKLTPKFVTMTFENLFNGDPVLGREMNRIINENWEALFKEHQRSIEETYGIMFRYIVSNIFNRVPFNKIFLP